MTSIEPPRNPFSSASRPHRVLLPGLLLLASCSSLQSSPVPAPPNSSPWHLVWSDEFDAQAGSVPDYTRWTYDIGGGGFGNHELETYTNRATNAQQRDGNLVLTARKEDLTGPDGIAQHYTSARLVTKSRFAQAFGRFEARMQLPLGKGIWPAFWLLGSDIDAVSWPACGEIDVMENIGDAATVYSTLHGPGYSGAHAISARYALPAGQAINSGFHIYAVEWSPNDIKFFFDDHLIAERTPTDLPPGARWVYDHPFFVILNLAVGGDWPGNPDSTTTFPQQMLVDYVRVYSRDAPPPVAATQKRRP